jgi:hypothetical protein
MGENQPLRGARGVHVAFDEVWNVGSISNGSPKPSARRFIVARVGFLVPRSMPLTYVRSNPT